MPDSHLFPALEFMAVLFIFVIGLGAAAVAALFVVDVCQRRDAIRHNFPVIGRFRYLFIKLGEFFRQYFFAMDREERPFNRAQRQWVDRAAAGRGNTSAFGSTQNNELAGTIIFVNCPFPTLVEDRAAGVPRIFGPYSAHPYTPASFFNISAMSYGSLSIPAIRALSHGARMAGCWLNTGEGGLSPYHLEGGCDLVFQIGTAKFGVRTEDGRLCDDKLRSVAGHEQVRMIEVKLSQGAKPGKGGILPAAKITPEIARIRSVNMGEDVVSPNRHPEIDSVTELLDMIERIRRITGKPVGFKTVLGSFSWLEALCEEVNRRGIKAAPDFITLDSSDGGTGAAPMPLLDNVGLSIRESLPMLANLLKKHGLKERVPLVASGKLVTPAEVAWALAAGADSVNNARGFMFALGCIQAMRCNQDTCPTGVTTHNPRLQKALNPEDKSAKVANYVLNITRDVEMIAHACGVPGPHRLRPFHVRIMQANGRSVALNELYPSTDAADHDPRAAAQAARTAAVTPVPGQP
ncbi:MAG: FMN-binding glutamate synthase family protein [Gammaproteobacteria bacterium]